MKQTLDNRYTKPLKEWQESQQRLSAVFSPSILKSKAFQREEWMFQQNLLRDIGRPKNLEERLTRKLLRQQKRELEKSLFPNRLLRLFRKLIVLTAQQFKGFVATTQSNPEIPRTTYRTSQELNRLTTFQSKTQTAKARLLQQDFIGQTRFLPNEQANLLQGRSVEKKGKWYRLDLADRDTKGRYPLKEIPFRFDLEAKLKKLPFDLPSQAAEKLRQGERVEIKTGDKTVQVEVNPMVRSLNFYDQHQKKVTMKQVMGGSEDIPTLSIGRRKKAGLSAG